MGIFQRLRAWYELNSAAPRVPDGLYYYCLPSADGRPFEHGVELLNDDATPMRFVLSVLQAEVNLSHRDATVAVALCQQEGGVIVPMPSLPAAINATTRISARAEQEAWPLRCRAVSAT